MKSAGASGRTNNRDSFSHRFKTDMRRNYSLYLLVLVVIVYYILFHFKPMYGALIAFQDYSPSKGMGGSPWVGLKHFVRFFQGPYFSRLITNTFLISFYNLLFGFPAPIILALLLNEVKNKHFKRVTQTISYMPHFISLIVIIGMLSQFASTNGLFNDIIVMFGGERSPLLMNPANYRPLYVASDIWQGVGWGSVIYLAALSGVDAQLYEAATIDGAGKWQQTLNVTLPGIAPTIIIMLILRIGNLMSVGYEKTILMYNSAIYETADIISSYVYRVGILEASWSFSTAVGLFNSVINFVLVIFANKVSSKVSETSLW
ncbi:ABC transporter permease subunit [Ruminococcaceae bacterium OttesenSCG-928-L11]|nr:ABC transporter permease subunit [Ruminococcaceae bacterium OttesenSCG-928-L11]